MVGVGVNEGSAVDVAARKVTGVAVKAGTRAAVLGVADVNSVTRALFIPTRNTAPSTTAHAKSNTAAIPRTKISVRPDLGIPVDTFALLFLTVVRRGVLNDWSVVWQIYSNRHVVGYVAEEGKRV
jgi:hypothetical protein